MQTQVCLATVTPWDEGNPVMHGPDIYGASVNKPFLYAVPTTGERKTEGTTKPNSISAIKLSV